MNHKKDARTSKYDRPKEDLILHDLDAEDDSTRMEDGSEIDDGLTSPKARPVKTSGKREQHSQPEIATEKKGIRKLLNPHLIFVVALLGILLFIFLRFSTWGQVIDLEEFFSHHEVEVQDDTLDTFLPLLDSEGNKVLTKKNPTILFLGNSPLTDCKEEETGVVNLIQKQTQGTVYNFAIADSYMASHTMNYYLPEYPLDPFCPYWMLLYMALGDALPYDLHNLPSMLGDSLPPEFPGILEQMDSIDMNTVDVIAIMYDATDYLLGHSPYNYDNPTDVTTFGGSLEGAIEIIQNTFPHIRIIVMSPTFAYALAEDGSYENSYLTAYHENDVLPTYVAMEGGSAVNRGVTFIDNFYGGFNEHNAEEYLTDHLHLNEKGRQLVADRFLSALEKYSEN